MIKILASDFGNYEEVNGEKNIHPISNENGIVDQLKESLKDTNKVVFISSDISSMPESVSPYAKIFFDSMKMVNIMFNEYLIIEGTNYKKASEYIEGADLVFLCGGDKYNQHKFFLKMSLKQILCNYSGVVIGQSAGALNMAVNVFNSPEEKEESEPIFYEGLGLTDINIEPHFKLDDASFNDKERYQRDAIIKESYNRVIYGQCDGSHIFINEKNMATIYGRTYLISNGKIEKICDNHKSLSI